MLRVASPLLFLINFLFSIVVLMGKKKKKEIKTSLRGEFPVKTTPSCVKISCSHWELTDLVWTVPKLFTIIPKPNDFLLPSKQNLGVFLLFQH